MNPIYEDIEGQTEEQLQQKCFFWFQNNYPENRGCLFHVPNGGNRSGREGKRFKFIGVVSGVSDLILLVGGRAFLIELKAKGKKQSKEQRAWEHTMILNGFDYYVIDTLAEFKETVEAIMKVYTNRLPVSKQPRKDYTDLFLGLNNKKKDE